MSGDKYNYVNYRSGQLYLEDVSLLDVAASVGTPAYVYSKAAISANISKLAAAFTLTPHKIHYSVKANSNLSVLSLCKELGTGFDIVSGGELIRVITAGGDPKDVIFSGVGKTVEEIDLALKLGIACFNVESTAELRRLSQRAGNLGVVAPVSIRVNPDVDANTHPYISTGLKQNKFGVRPDVALSMYRDAAADANLNCVGIDCHIGSQISDVAPMLDALKSLLDLVDELQRQDITLEHIDLGGGMGVTYQNETPLDLGEYGAQVQQIIGSRPHTIYLEPGRSIVANAGILLTTVEYTKPPNGPPNDKDSPSFAVVDAAMNDLIRPALYQAWHEVLPVTQHPAMVEREWDVVGPICESGDFIAKSRTLALDDSDVLAILSAGAYGMVQASNYNSRGRACEVMVDGNKFTLVRRRENIEDMLRLEREFLTLAQGQQGE